MGTCGCCKNKICKYKIIFRVFVANEYDLNINDYYDSARCLSCGAGLGILDPEPAICACNCKKGLYEYSYDTSLVGCGLLNMIQNPNSNPIPDTSCVESTKLEKLNLHYSFDNIVYTTPKIESLSIYIENSLEATDEFKYIKKLGTKFKNYNKNNCSQSDLLPSKVKYDYYRGVTNSANAKMINPKTGTDINADFKIKGFRFTSIGDLGYIYLNSKEKFKANIKFFNDDGTVYSGASVPVANNYTSADQPCSPFYPKPPVEFNYIQGEYIIEDQIEADLNLLDTSSSTEQKVFIYPIIITYSGKKYKPSGGGGGTIIFKSKIIPPSPAYSSSYVNPAYSKIINPIIASLGSINDSLPVQNSLELCHLKSETSVAIRNQFPCIPTSPSKLYSCGFRTNKVVKLPTITINISPSFTFNNAYWKWYNPITKKIETTPIVALNSTIKTALNAYYYIDGDSVILKTKTEHSNINLAFTKSYSICENSKDITNSNGDIFIDNIVDSEKSYAIESSNSSFIALPAQCGIGVCSVQNTTVDFDPPPPKTIGMYYTATLGSLFTSAGLYFEGLCNGVPYYDVTKVYAKKNLSVSYSLVSVAGEGACGTNGLGCGDLYIDNQLANDLIFDYSMAVVPLEIFGIGG